jgi:hypothetical protein
MCTGRAEALAAPAPRHAAQSTKIAKPRQVTRRP